MKHKSTASVFSSAQIPALLAAAMCGLLTQCTIQDPRYDALAARVETNPAKTAIVGMWHWSQDEGLGDKTGFSCLFKSDGTGVFRFFSKVNWSPLPDALPLASKSNRQMDFTWTYDRGGMWTIKLKDCPESSTRCRISGNNLLMTTINQAGENHQVCVRVE